MSLDDYLLAGGKTTQGTSFIHRFIILIYETQPLFLTVFFEEGTHTNALALARDGYRYIYKCVCVCVSWHCPKRFIVQCIFHRDIDMDFHPIIVTRFTWLDKNRHTTQQAVSIMSLCLFKSFNIRSNWLYYSYNDSSSVTNIRVEHTSPECWCCPFIFIRMCRVWNTTRQCFVLCNTLVSIYIYIYIVIYIDIRRLDRCLQLYPRQQPNRIIDVAIAIQEKRHI